LKAPSKWTPETDDIHLNKIGSTKIILSYEPQFQMVLGEGSFVARGIFKIEPLGGCEVQNTINKYYHSFSKMKFVHKAHQKYDLIAY
jgi:hypothetical protein